MKKSSIEQPNRQLSNLVKVVVFSGIIFAIVWLFILQNTNPITVEERKINSTELEDSPATPSSTRLENPPNIPSEETKPKNQGTVQIGTRTFTFDPTHVGTVRPDIFKPGYFSIFDVLVQLNKQGDINLQYHFDETKNTHIIDSIDQETDWWYQVYYSGGWPERNAFRPDHYPWKDQTTLTFYKETSLRINRIYTVWEEEVTRKNNNQAVIIPEVEIRSLSFKETFENVTVTAHNLRNDVFREGTITAIDVILSLEEQGKISYELQYYKSVGNAGLVKSYWVESINQDVASGKCGYVYEAGSPEFQFSSGNHIHLPSDTRVLNSPEYVDYFWICI